MTFKSLIPLISAQCLLSACSLMDRHARDVDLDVQHTALAKHFEEEANELQARIEEHQEFLNQFETKRYLYGRHANDLKAHNQEVIDLYQQAITANRDMADMVRGRGH